MRYPWNKTCLCAVISTTSNFYSKLYFDKCLDVNILMLHFVAVQARARVELFAAVVARELSW